MRIPSGLPPGPIELGSSLLRWSVVIFRSFFDNYLSRFRRRCRQRVHARAAMHRSIDDHAWWRAASTDLTVECRWRSERGGQVVASRSCQVVDQVSSWRRNGAAGHLECSYVAWLSGACNGGVYIGWQWSNFFISTVFRHFVGQALRNVCYSDVSGRHFLNNIAIVRTFS